MLTDRQKELIEKIGLVHEQEGLSPAVSRVLGLLLVSDQIELTFDEIRETLNLSKSATSNALNIAMKINRVEYITKPGDRKRYFRSKIHLWRENLMADYRKKACWADILKEVCKCRCSETKEFNHALTDLVDFVEYMSQEIPRLYKCWEQDKTK
ncbi:GbsR/MarR family transcriptional regulator [Fulvivirga sediminis]|uniref:MarR family transcriptional regulator n=1 Tax=Fulvivirga sediminis TaxID=2803949 RepID=A0A937K210_9BACT|nr:MarR family transcriptional regulator [Fulvivirga sediminis]MBL3657880.1 MarR family transcriptional regulator [Fulvivirga sediminis]